MSIHVGAPEPYHPALGAAFGTQPHLKSAADAVVAAARLKGKAPKKDVVQTAGLDDDAQGPLVTLPMFTLSEDPLASQPHSPKPTPPKSPGRFRQAAKLVKDGALVAAAAAAGGPLGAAAAMAVLNKSSSKSAKPEPGDCAETDKILESTSMMYGAN